MQDGDKVRITKLGTWIATQRPSQFWGFSPVPAGAVGTLRFGFDYQKRLMDDPEPMDYHLDMWHIEFDKYPNRKPTFCCGLGDEIPDWVERIEECSSRN